VKFPQPRAQKEFERGRRWFVMWFLPLTGFILLGLLVLFDELYDLPNVLLNAPKTPINWHEVILEAAIVLAIGSIFMFMLMRAIAHARCSDNKMIHLHRALLAIRNVNQIIIKEKDIRKLLQRACDTMVETRGYSGACIILLESSSEFQASADVGLSETFRTLITQIREGRPPDWINDVIGINEIVTMDNRLLPFKSGEAYHRHNEQGVLASRLESHGKVYGIVLVSLPVIVMNDREEQSLLEEMAGDVAFALHDIANERRRRESEERYKTLFEGASEGILVVDTEKKRFIYANPEICSMLGYSVEELTNFCIEDIHPVEELEKVISEYEEHINGQRTLSETIRCLKKDGNIILVDITSSPMVIDDKNCIVGFFRDVTKRNHLEEQFRQAQKLEAVGQLAGGIAHDFNNMLTIILGHCDLMKEDIPENDPLLESLVQIRSSGEKAASLTRQLLAYSRKQKLNPIVLNLNEIILNLEKMLQRLIGENIQLQTNLTGDLGLTKADAGQIEQIIMNLAVNARDAMPDGGKLIIETENVFLDEEYAKNHIGAAPGHYVMLAMTDTGHGMDEKTRARIFEPFFTTKELGRGTGLGLSTVYGIVKQSGGGIWVYSEPERGTIFKIYLPSAEDAVRTVEKKKRVTVGGNESILVVEDDPAIRRLMERVLKMLGYTPTIASDGEEAIKIVSENRLMPDLLITDIIMPGMTGILLAERLKEAMPELKVLFMSGYSYGSIGNYETLKEDMNFIEKPFNRDELSEKIREVLDTDDRLIH